MAARSATLDIAIGLAAGYVATIVTDRAQRALWQATPECEKEREPKTAEGSSAMAAARCLAGLSKASMTEEELRQFKSLIHYGLGAVWATLYPLLRRYGGMRPSTAGVVTGTSLSLIVDEAICPALGFSAPSSAYPASSHVRGLLTHLVYGLSVTAAAEGLHYVAKGRWRWAPAK